MTSVSNSSDGQDQHDLVGTRRQPRPGTVKDELQRLLVRVPSFQDASSRFHGAPLQSGQVRLALFPEAIDEIARHANSDTAREVGGVLLGQAYRHDDHLLLDVRQALPAHTSDSGPIHFTFNADAWSQLHRDRAEKYPALDIVGWFHTHPGLGIFFSADDVVVHSAAFVLPWHIALVVDPLSKQVGAFARRDSELEPLPGFYEIGAGASNTSRLPWRLVKGEIWDESYMEHLAMQRQHPRKAGSGNGASRYWPALIVAALSVLLSAVLLVVGIIPLRSENEALQAIVASLARQNIKEANARGTASCPAGALQIFAPVPGASLLRGEEVTLVGTAEVADAASYALEVRPTGERAWWLLGTVRRQAHTAQFLNWDTTSFAPGSYDMRLVALDETGEALAKPPPCSIPFEITTGTTEVE